MSTSALALESNKKHSAINSVLQRGKGQRNLTTTVHADFVVGTKAYCYSLAI